MSGDVNAAAETIRRLGELADAVDRDRGHAGSLLTATMRDAAREMAALVAEVESLRERADKNAAMWESACDEAEQLRAERDAAREANGRVAASYERACDEADALRVEKQHLEERLALVDRKHAEAMAREQRLQEALEQIVGACDAWEQDEQGLADIARAALAATDPPEETPPHDD